MRKPKAKRNPDAITIRLGRKAVGTVEYGTFRQHRQFSKHLFRAGEADAETAIAKGKASIGLSGEVIRKLEALGVTKVLTRDDETARLYETTLESFRTYGFWRTFSSGDPQLFLPLQYWSCSDPCKVTPPVHRAVSPVALLMSGIGCI